jgi:hypothetical protein
MSINRLILFITIEIILAFIFFMFFRFWGMIFYFFKSETILWVSCTIIDMISNIFLFYLISKSLYKNFKKTAESSTESSTENLVTDSKKINLKYLVLFIIFTFFASIAALVIYFLWQFKDIPG